MTLICEAACFHASKKLAGKEPNWSPKFANPLSLPSTFLLSTLFIYLFLATLGLPCGARASHCGGFSCCGAWALGTQASVVVARGLGSCGSQALECRLNSCGAWGLVAPWHVRSSRSRARTHVPCIGRWILNHCATREALSTLHNCLLLTALSRPFGPGILEAWATDTGVFSPGVSMLVSKCGSKKRRESGILKMAFRKKWTPFILRVSSLQNANTTF